MNHPSHIDIAARERRRIRVRGLVQGVGFRPHVYRCAERYGVSGFVSNGPEGVLIEAEGNNLDLFTGALRSGLPPLARIDRFIESPMPPTGDTVFSIAATTNGAAAGAAIPADTAICHDCLQELFDPSNRRFLHPFIACTNCGPRYTMTRRLPYDRDSTTMAEFPLCQHCEAEYATPSERRFHAEPVACHDCGPQLSLDIAQIAAALKRGEIVALKGIGGYHLICDARNDATVRRLRSNKRRDGKPFAVMVLNTESAARYINLDDQTLTLLQSPERPVVITDKGGSGVELDVSVSCGLATLGVMLPYTGVQYLLFHALLGEPASRDWLNQANDLVLVMTSANLSGEPLITCTDEAEQKLSDVADLIVHHDRVIAARADDAVVRVAGASAPLIIRRGRGFTPHAIKLPADGPSVLALGAHLKTTVTMTRGNRAWLSPHVGDLDTPAAICFHADMARAMQDMLQCAPQVIACDLSRDFPSTLLAESLSDELNLPLVRVQHHHAHVAAVIAEHRVDQPVLGVALDGFGLGSDGEAWGGELLRVDGDSSQRIGHLAPLLLPGGDRAAREPWRMAAGVLHLLGRTGEISGRFVDEQYADLMPALLASGEVATTTSAGRLFDAAAGLLGVCKRSTFEGQAPMLLEGLAGESAQIRESYRCTEGLLDFLPLLGTLADCDDPVLGATIFHTALVAGLTEWVSAAAGSSGLSTVALSGGCMLNSHLARHLRPALEGCGLRVLQPIAMPTNDAAISLGQAWVAQLASG